MRRTALATALAAVAAALGGCGTAANFRGTGWSDTHIYGGVIYDVKCGMGWFKRRATSPNKGIQHDIGTGVGLGLISLDTTLCVFTDTLTLPITVPVAIWATPANAPDACNCAPPPTPPPPPAAAPPAAPVPPVR